jgi:hypothetical protein
MNVAAGFSPRAGIRGFDTSLDRRPSTSPHLLVSVPERGFVALIPSGERVGAGCSEQCFSPRAGIRGFDTVVVKSTTGTGYDITGVSVPERGFVALIRRIGRLYDPESRKGVSVPERGFVALIPDHRRPVPLVNRHPFVSVPERGFVALILV